MTLRQTYTFVRFAFFRLKIIPAYLLTYPNYFAVCPFFVLLLKVIFLTLTFDL